MDATNRFNQPIATQHTVLPQPLVRANTTPVGLQRPATESGALKLINKDDYGASANAGGRASPTKMLLADRRSTTPGRTSAKQGANEKSSANVSRRQVEDDEEEDADGFRRSPVMATLNMLKDNSSGKQRDEWEEKAKGQGLDVLSRLNVLLEATEKLASEKDLDRTKKRKTGYALKEMIVDLVKKHKPELRKGMQEQNQLVAAIEALVGVDDPLAPRPDIHKLRFELFGPKARKDNVDVELKVSSAYSNLMRVAGKERFIVLMQLLRTQLARRIYM